MGVGVDVDPEEFSFPPDFVGAGVVPEESDGLDVVDPVEELEELSLFVGGVVGVLPVEPEVESF